MQIVVRLQRVYPVLLIIAFFVNLQTNSCCVTNTATDEKKEVGKTNNNFRVQLISPLPNGDIVDLGISTSTSNRSYYTFTFEILNPPNPSDIVCRALFNNENAQTTIMGREFTISVSIDLTREEVIPLQAEVVSSGITARIEYRVVMKKGREEEKFTIGVDTRDQKASVNNILKYVATATLPNGVDKVDKWEIDERNTIKYSDLNIVIAEQSHLSAEITVQLKEKTSQKKGRYEIKIIATININGASVNATAAVSASFENINLKFKELDYAPEQSNNKITGFYDNAAKGSKISGDFTITKKGSDNVLRSGEINVKQGYETYPGYIDYEAGSFLFTFDSLDFEIKGVYKLSVKITDGQTSDEQTVELNSDNLNMITFHALDRQAYSTDIFKPLSDIVRNLLLFDIGKITKSVSLRVSFMFDCKGLTQDCNFDLSEHILLVNRNTNLDDNTKSRVSLNWNRSGFTISPDKSNHQYFLQLRFNNEGLSRFINSLDKEGEIITVKTTISAAEGEVQLVNQDRTGREVVIETSFNLIISPWNMISVSGSEWQHFTTIDRIREVRTSQDGSLLFHWNSENKLLYGNISRSLSFKIISAPIETGEQIIDGLLSDDAGKVVIITDKAIYQLTAADMSVVKRVPISNSNYIPRFLLQYGDQIAVIGTPFVASTHIYGIPAGDHIIYLITDFKINRSDWSEVTELRGPLVVGIRDTISLVDNRLVSLCQLSGKISVVKLPNTDITPSFVHQPDKALLIKEYILAINKTYGKAELWKFNSNSYHLVKDNLFHDNFKGEYSLLAGSLINFSGQQYISVTDSSKSLKLIRISDASILSFDQLVPIDEQKIKYKSLCGLSGGQSVLYLVYYTIKLGLSDVTQVVYHKSNN